MTANKHDNNKPPLALVPYEFTEAIAEILQHGAEKYGAWNWIEGMDWDRLLSATYRHLGAWQSGEDVDKESGKSHLAHAACNLMFLMTYQKHDIGNDNRYKF